MPDARLLAEQATTLLQDRQPGLGGTRLGVVDGPSGSGKSTFARLWVEVVRERGARSVALFSADLLATWDDPFGWWARFETGVLEPLAQQRPGRIRVADWSCGEPSPGHWADVRVADVLILEGVSCGRAALGDRVGVSVWLQPADRRTRLERAVARDGESSRVRLAAWQDDEDAFFEHDRPANRADFVVSPSWLVRWGSVD